MVEEVEKLEADAERRIFPARNSRALHDREIGIEVMRPPKAVAPLLERHRRTIANTRHAEASGIESGFAPSLHKRSARRGCDRVGQVLGWQARIRRERNRCTLAARWIRTEWADWYSI